LLAILISAIKIIVIFGFLIIIHEAGHFLVARLMKVKVNEFSIGFGPKIWKKETKETIYTLRAIPLGGFVNMEGEAEPSNKEGSFSCLSIPKRFLIVSAGAVINIVFGLLLCLIVFWIMSGNFLTALATTGQLIIIAGEGIRDLFTSAGTAVDQFMGPVGISSVISSSQGILEFLYMVAVISFSLGITNLLPIPALDGGKLLLLIIEAIRRKPLKQNIELAIQACRIFSINGISSLRNN